VGTSVSNSVNELLSPAPCLEPDFGKKLRFLQPSLPPLDTVMTYYASAYHAGLITNSELVARFEQAAAERLQVRQCVAVSSCTNGLVLVMRSLGLTGEVILPSFTFFATGHAVVWNGLRPVLADCDAETWNVDPRSVERLITKRTSAILGVHLYGNPCDVESLSQIASKHGIKLIFDAAHSFGSQYRGRPVGQFGDAEVFSLSPTKVLVAGEGGLVATNDAALARRVRAARNYGDLGAYDPELLGLSARMSEFGAALALASLEMLEAKVARRNRIADTYTSLLRPLHGLGFQKVRPEDRSTYKDYSVHIDAGVFPLDRDRVAGMLAASEIETRKYFWPSLHRQKLYKCFYHPSREPLHNTNRVSEGILSLPIYESLPDEAVQSIVQVFHAIGGA